tara:strand:- start:12 stop:122 length:111 start_codon:yes stop_codon:yes gene_type:complete
MLDEKYCVGYLVIFFSKYFKSAMVLFWLNAEWEEEK